MEKSVIFWALVVTAFVLLLSIFSLGNAMKVYIKSDTFKNKVNKIKENNTIKTLLLLLAFVATSTGTFAQDAATSAAEVSFYTTTKIYILLAIDLALVAFLVYYRNFFNKLINIDKKEEDEAPVQEFVKERTSKLTQILTDTVPVEEEESILMDHEYDGIQELDNNLPPWWIYGFYLSIIAGVLYLLNYHVFKISPLQEEAYQTEVKEAKIAVDLYLKEQALNVDENTVTVLTDDADISKGRMLFNQYCIACHKEGGGGDVGPNLTDDYWIHGGKINDVFKTIKYGAQNGMKSWKDELNPVQMQQVASYIKSLRGTNPPNAKEPQGDLYVEEGTAETEVEGEVADTLNVE
ncbi:cbb3-type cytochrome c oxidase N-terminal domain-containing protein [Lishizhenia sp.]|uniref:cbb3-type cytochrome c oxidase N-terminal domain-containing protein n=1 Tax=Lishizhenia sp. TaxID=2497594 RepID=UPI00299DB31A|nr:cbb3-type cytochrome c oxidase N-terminal domain-containing protein [Lishizhenia sp.]MDX1444923.1 cbb3-type cytochrome c oxidase N-terminal domain-containing protein [Lishizhenia sp.]